MSLAHRLLARAHDQHLVSAFDGGQERLLDVKAQGFLGRPSQRAFQYLLDERLIQECGRDGFDDGQRCKSVYAPTSAGLARLRDCALERSGRVRISALHWHESPRHLDWNDPWLLWDRFNGLVLGEVLDEDDRTIDDNAVLAEVGMFRLNARLQKASDFDCADLMEADTVLSSYAALARDRRGRWVDLEDIPALLGLREAGIDSLLLLDRLKIRAPYLGLGLGGQIIRRLFLRYAPGGGIAAITPFPLQFAGRGDIESDHVAFEQAERRLRAYYRRLGFIDHPWEASLMVCDLSRAHFNHLPLEQY